MTPSQASLSSIISQSTRRPARRGPTAGPYRGMRQRDARPLGLLPRFLLLLLEEGDHLEDHLLVLRFVVREEHVVTAEVDRLDLIVRAEAADHLLQLVSLEDAVARRREEQRGGRCY